ncbi:hypothetical protein BDA96_07G104700 [Sorghum bicolor]|uniref:Uncharacterized protein n=2 Tax=Sorghum bicolor TaxID=4558 RepID=A0A1B6Q3E5_SORBI|nr:hypothetical protein BDA96_07G104700 [Sorghum bicolor]KXG32457.1 hypothetical protein SORBI_3003G157800 [Sorghum bicolor]KXG32458.1 hypothetical protein SORBI_3003G157800 [Sorghum bicolor]
MLPVMAWPALRPTAAPSPVPGDGGPAWLPIPNQWRPSLTGSGGPPLATVTSPSTDPHDGGRTSSPSFPTVRCAGAPESDRRPCTANVATPFYWRRKEAPATARGPWTTSSDPRYPSSSYFLV